MCISFQSCDFVIGCKVSFCAHSFSITKFLTLRTQGGQHVEKRDMNPMRHE
jgi:hypothetical protein